MNQEEMLIARDARRQLERRPIDVTMAVVSVSRGAIIVSGQVRGLKTEPLVDVQHELEMFRRTAPRFMRNVKDIIFECRVVGNPKRAKPGEHTQGGEQSHIHKTAR